MRHIHYIVQGYRAEKEDGGLADAVTVEVFSDCEDGAIDRAKTLVTKPHYRVSSIIEHDTGYPCSAG